MNFAICSPTRESTSANNTSRCWHKTSVMIPSSLRARMRSDPMPLLDLSRSIPASSSVYVISAVMSAYSGAFQKELQSGVECEYPIKLHFINRLTQVANDRQTKPKPLGSHGIDLVFGGAGENND